MYAIIIVYILVFAVSYFGVREFRRWSLKRNLLDIPNERSSHTAPTPRGGGLIIFSVSIITFFLYALFNGGDIYWAYFAGALIVGTISLLDDIRAVSPLIRFICHGAAAAIVIWSLGGFESIWIPCFGVQQIGFWGKIIAFFWIVWLINAYNFMDGIDGIAAAQAITAGAGWCLLGFILGIQAVGFFGGILLFTALGFGIHNWQPARIFMGDVGSAFLGYSFAVMPLLAAFRTGNVQLNAILPWIAVFCVWFFIFDSVLTFLKRLFRGERVWHAHREHLYQKMVVAGLSHAEVTGLYWLLSLILVSTLVISAGLSLKLEKLLFAVIISETTLLIIIWQVTVRKEKKNTYE